MKIIQIEKAVVIEPTPGATKYMVWPKENANVVAELSSSKVPSPIIMVTGPCKILWDNGQMATFDGNQWHISEGHAVNLFKDFYDI